MTVVLAVAAPARSEDQPTAPSRLFTLGGEASGSFSSAPDRGFFNDSAYGRSYGRDALRLGLLRLEARLQAGPHLALIGELRTENLDTPRLFALYARLRPFLRKELDLQVGRIPPVFGAFPRRRYGTDDPLIGYPLAYQYLTSLRPDAAPASAADVLRNRGAGWWPYYPVGGTARQTGLPLVNPLLWDTGVEVRIGRDPVELALAVTQGTLSSPRVRDNNDGKQVAGRLALRPTFGLVLGVSAARGEYLDRQLGAELPSSARDRTYRQTALGLDLEYSAGYWLLRAEAIRSAWDVPVLDAPRIESPLAATAVMLEARYTVAPGLYLAGRMDHLGFSGLTASDPVGWDAPVTRIEGGLGYKPTRRVLLKLSYQQNWRDGGRVRERGVLAGQVLLWF